MVSERVCPKCDGTGFIIIERGNISGAKPCDCRVQGRAARCSFCDTTQDLETCGWQVWKPGLVRAGDLTMEHTIVTRGGRQLRPLMVQTVDAIGILPQTGRSYLIERRCAVVYALNYGKERYWLLYKGINETMSVMKMVPCGAVCCPLCRAERGDSAICCRDHWMSWREVA